RCKGVPAVQNPEDPGVVIVGAGPAGLGAAGCLVQRGVRPLVIEREAQVAASWRAHYERLHLHTVKTLSALPGMPFPEHTPRYVPRQGVVDYLSAYALQHHIEPVFGEDVASIVPHARGWKTVTVSGREFVSRAVVLATGANREPRKAVFPGRERYLGQVVHSQAYRNAKPFAGQRVLVVGMGNTGAEIALDLAEHGVQTALSVRSPVNMVYRDVLGRPTQVSSILLSKLPTAWGDWAATLLRNWTVGDLRRWGLRTANISPLRQLREHGKTPVIDVGTLACIKRGQIAVRPGIETFTAQGIRFNDATEQAFDTVILATGYDAHVAKLFPGAKPELDASGMPRDVVGRGAMSSVYFVGFDIRQPGGLLRAIAAQAQQVAQAITSAHPATP
ncbi:MAG: NAD(P)/FAD-dependent oxidoreductase, partial [Burkholderiaceae bacterium]